MKLRIYYGRPSQTVALEAPEAVWSDYHAVYHMSEHPGGVSDRGRYDSSVTDWADGTPNGSPSTSTDLLAGGVNMGGLDANYVDIGQPNVTASSVTIQAYVNVDSLANGDARVISKAQGVSDADHVLMVSTIPITGGGHQWRARLRVNDFTYTYIRPTPYDSGITADGTTGYWVSFAYDGNEIYDVVNGSPGDQGGYIQAAGSITQNAWPAMIGNQPNGVGGVTTGKAFNGEISEVRVCKLARDADWLATEYAMLANPDAIISAYGAEVDLSGGLAITLTDTIATGDSVDPSYVEAVPTLTDSVSTTDILSGDAGFQIAALESTIGVTDSLDVQQITPVRLTDTVAVTDSVVRIVYESNSVTDALVVDMTVDPGDVRESVTDLITFSDTLQQSYAETLFETVTITDPMVVYPPATTFTKSVRERVIEAVLTTLNAITPSGYTRENGTWAFRYQLDDVQRPDPHLFVMIASESKRETSHHFDCQLVIEVVALVAKHGATGDTVLDQIVADVENALIADPQWDSNAIDTELMGHDRGITDTREFYATVRAQISYRHSRTNARAIG